MKWLVKDHFGLLTTALSQHGNHHSRGVLGISRIPGMLRDVTHCGIMMRRSEGSVQAPAMAATPPHGMFPLLPDSESERNMQTLPGRARVILLQLKAPKQPANSSCYPIQEMKGTCRWVLAEVYRTQGELGCPKGTLFSCPLRPGPQPAPTVPASPHGTLYTPLHRSNIGTSLSCSGTIRNCKSGALNCAFRSGIGMV